MTTARRLNIPLSVLLALGVACGLGGVGGLSAMAGVDWVGVEDGVPGDVAEAVNLVDGEPCRSALAPTPRLRASTRCQPERLELRRGGPLGR